MLIAGCSHTAGSEIDGSEDSSYNRQHSFGNQLASKMGYRPINMAEPGSTNPTIARSVLQWFKEEYNSFTMDVYVLIGWTESSRMEVPWHRLSHYHAHNPYGNYNPTTSTNYLRVNLGWGGTDPEEKELIPEYHRFMAMNETYLEIVSANAVLQLQYFLDSKNIDYLMCNTMHMFNPTNTHLDFYKSLVDATKYYKFDNNDDAFFWKYKNAGYENPKAKYWHHDEAPHRMFADELYNFIEAENVYNQMV